MLNVLPMHNHYFCTVFSTFFCMFFVFVLKFLYSIKMLKIWQNKKKCTYGKIRLFLAFFQIFLKYGKKVWRHFNMAFDLLWS
jgi:hypothetical protein